MADRWIPGDGAPTAAQGVAYLRRFFPCPHFETIERSVICANCGADDGESCPIRQAVEAIEAELSIPPPSDRETAT